MCGEKMKQKIKVKEKEIWKLKEFSKLVNNEIRTLTPITQAAFLEDTKKEI